ncbi:hypothetical protein K0B03_01895 [Patescibacteria group bacterium]|nr:hypothetical protein [Patescibacteria group bacterium]
MKSKKDFKFSFLSQIIIVFLITSILSIAVANSMISGRVAYTPEPVRSVYVPPQEQPQVISSEMKPEFKLAQIDVFQFLVSFLIATALMLLFINKSKGKYLFEFFFSAAIIFGAQGPFGIFFSWPYALMFSIVLVIFRFVYPRIWTQNIIIIIGIAGISAALGTGIKDPLFAIIILIILSVYDIIAVYKTKHMVTLFKGMAEKGAVLALVIPKNFLFWKKKFSIIKLENKNEFIFLGTGDIALPLFFATSVFAQGLSFSIAVVFGASIGLITDHLIFVSQKQKKALPALPAIAFFSIFFYLVSFLFIK